MLTHFLYDLTEPLNKIITNFRPVIPKEFSKHVKICNKFKKLQYVSVLKQRLEYRENNVNAFYDLTKYLNKLVTRFRVRISKKFSKI